MNKEKIREELAAVQKKMTVLFKNPDSTTAVPEIFEMHLSVLSEHLIKIQKALKELSRSIDRKTKKELYIMQEQIWISLEEQYSILEKIKIKELKSEKTEKIRTRKTEWMLTDFDKRFLRVMHIVPDR